MIDGLKAHTTYRATPSRWIGRIPAHWELRNLRTLITPRNERNRPDLPLLSVAREKGVFVRSVDDENHNVIPENLTNYKVARAGSLVINKMKAWQGSMGIAPCDGIVSPAYFVYDLRVSNPSFGQLLLRSRPYVAHFAQASDGVRVGQWDLSIAGMREIPVALPPADEQAAIVRFLNHAIRRIESYMRAKRKLIALLSEQKQTIIRQTVTRGLDPNAPTQDSGVPWLRAIPAHWDVRRIKQVAKIVRGTFTHRPRNDPSLYGGPYPFIQTGAVAKAERTIVSYKQTLNERGLAVSTLFPAGTLVMTIAANIGDVAILGFDSCFPDSIVGFELMGKSCRDYFYLVLKTMKAELLREAPVNTQGNLNVERIGTMSIPVPTLNEQDAIVDWVDRQTAPLETVRSRAEREIGLMREYRTRLVADIVTGQLDVREAAKRLPAEELESVEADDPAVPEDEEPEEGEAA